MDNIEKAEIRAIELVRHPERLGVDTVDVLRRLLTRYPYYQTLRLLLLENLYKIHSPEFNEELRRSAPLLANREVLFELVEGDNYEIEQQTLETAQQNEGGDRMLALIESYLSDKPTETITHRMTAGDAAQDYASYLIQMEEEEEGTPFGDLDDADDLVSSFKHRETLQIDNAEESAPAASSSDDEGAPKEEYFTETLAQICIKQRKYERALEIIKALSTNNPKKNRYFADQIRFLEKLVLINKNKKTDNV